MPEQAKVEDLEVFRVFRAALVKFAQAAEQALAGADGHISKTRAWLEGEQRRYWEAQARKRAEAVTQARDAVRQKKLFADGSGRKRDASEEEKALKRAEAALAEAVHKIEAVRKALPKLDRENDLYRGGVARLNGALAGDVPKALALLDRLAGRLEAYLQVEGRSEASPAVTGASDAEPAITRGEVIEPAPPAAGTGGATGTAGVTGVAGKDSQGRTAGEARDVADGQ
jgi:hypothetical protein